MPLTEATQTSEEALATFYESLQQHNVQPLWPIAEELMPPAPRPRARP